MLSHFTSETNHIITASPAFIEPTQWELNKKKLSHFTRETNHIITASPAFIEPTQWELYIFFSFNF